MKSLPLGGCSPMSILIATVIAGIILIMAASVNDSVLSPGDSTPVLVSPLVIPASDVGGDTVVVSGESVVSGQSVAGSDVASNGSTEACATGCMMDNMCGGTPTIIARANPETGTRYYYAPNHPEYAAFRTADTQGAVNYYFCTTDQAEAQGWTPAP